VQKYKIPASLTFKVTNCSLQQLSQISIGSWQLVICNRQLAAGKQKQAAGKYDGLFNK
jgi:hypothetical protein